MAAAREEDRRRDPLDRDERLPVVGRLRLVRNGRVSERLPGERPRRADTRVRPQAAPARSDRSAGDDRTRNERCDTVDEVRIVSSNQERRGGGGARPARAATRLRGGRPERVPGRRPFLAFVAGTVSSPSRSCSTPGTTAGARRTHRPPRSRVGRIGRRRLRQRLESSHPSTASNRADRRPRLAQTQPARVRRRRVHQHPSNARAARQSRSNDARWRDHMNQQPSPRQTQSGSLDALKAAEPCPAPLRDTDLNQGMSVPIKPKAVSPSAARKAPRPSCLNRVAGSEIG